MIDTTVLSLGENTGLHALPFCSELKDFSFSSWAFDNQQDWLKLPKGYHHFGFVFDGRLTLKRSNLSYQIGQGMYFSAPCTSEFSIEARNCCGIIMSQKGFSGLFQIGGPVEEDGRLHYIDGCSDTLLVPPTRKGEACVNFLKLPVGTNQTFHTHPSFRFGLVYKGTGFCDTNSRSIPLSPGKVFFIPTDGLHRFRTEESTLSVIAFHPDSDFGPDDDNHPMVNKTIVDGVSASKLSYQQRGIEL